MYFKGVFKKEIYPSVEFIRVDTSRMFKSQVNTSKSRDAGVDSWNLFNWEFAFHCVLTHEFW